MITDNEYDIQNVTIKVKKLVNCIPSDFPLYYIVL